jgi:DNA (cytosine-5)-methyltransferase 1
MSNPHAWFLSDLTSIPSNGINVMSTFACGGGSSMGYKRAGCTIIAANDIDPEMAWNYQKNLAPKHYFLCPIRDLLSADLPPELFDLDILDGSPPCSTFSMAGSREKGWGKDKHFREGQAKQVLSDLFFDYLDLVERLRPKVAIAENVKGMILGNAKGYTKLVMARFRELGYRPQLFLVNAADCGVPQRRERVFFCAIRDDIVAPPLRLAPTHRWINCGEATSDLTITPDELRGVAFTSNTDLVWWPKTLQGENYGDAVKRTGQPVKLWNHVKLDANAPSLTLTATHAMIKHWKEPRCLTFREYARLGSFPDDYQVKSSNIGKYIIGMSVPPKMTEQVARAVVDQWLQPKGLGA